MLCHCRVIPLQGELPAESRVQPCYPLKITEQQHQAHPSHLSLPAVVADVLLSPLIHGFPTPQPLHAP